MSSNQKIKIGTGMVGLALVLGIIAATCFILSNLHLRLDLTEQKLYSLSGGTKKVLEHLDQDVRLKFYCSNGADVPMDLKTYARRVDELLQEYRLAGRGHIVVEKYDPAPDSDAEEAAQREGLEPQTENPFAPPVYCGLVAKCGDQLQSLAALSPQNDVRLEYEVSRLIARVAFPKKPVIGVLSSLPVMGMPQNPMMMMQQQPRNEGWMAFKVLKMDYELRTVPVDADHIDPEINTLIVVHPKNLTDPTLYAIDQFVLRGGRMIVCVDPCSAVDARSNNDPSNPMMRMMGGAAPSTLGKIFDAWGITFDTSKVVADTRAITRLGSGDGQVIESPTFLSLNPSGMNRTDLLMAQINNIMLPYAGAVSFHAGNGKLVFTPLITSSADASGLMESMSAQFAALNSSTSPHFKPDGHSRVLAARLKGTFPTAFPNGLAGASGVTNIPANHLVSGDSVVLVFADTDFLADESCVQMVQTMLGAQPRLVNDNLSLFANAVEQLTGREELIGIRARSTFHRPFTVVDDLENQAMLAWQSKAEELSKELQETKAQIDELQQQKKGAQRLVLSKEQQSAIERFRAREIEINRQLKNVQKNLRKDIDSLGVVVKTVNLATIPVLVIIFGVVRHSVRRRRK